MFRSSLIVSFFSFLSRISGYIRDLIIAAYLGTGIFNDIFVACFRIPNFFRVIVAEGVVNLAFIPIYRKFEIDKKNEEENKIIFLSNLFIWTFLVVAPAIILIEIFMPQVINIFAPGFKNTEYFELSVYIARIIIPYALFVILSSLLIGTLNSYKYFAVTSSIQIIVNFAIITGLILLGSNQILSVKTIAWSCIFAGLIQILILHLSIKKKFRVKLIYPSKSQEINDFVKILIPSFFIFFLFQLTKFFAYFVGSYEVGAISYIYFSERIYQIPVGIVSLAITTAILPTVSKLLIDNQVDLAKQYFGQAFEYTMLFIIPSALVFFFYSELIVSTLFQRGEFMQESVINTSDALKIFALGLPAYAVMPLFIEYFIINKKIKIFIFGNFIISIISMFIIWNLFNDMGFIGILWGLISFYWINFFFIILYLSYSNFSFFSAKILFTVIKLIVCSLIMIIGINILNYLIISSGIWKLLMLIIVGFTTYCFAIFLIHKKIIYPLFSILSRKSS